MRCLYCGKRLALLKKLTDGDFCSVAHRRKFQAEQEHLAVARLAENEEQLTKSSAEGNSNGPWRSKLHPAGVPTKFGVFVPDEPVASLFPTTILNASHPLPHGAAPSLPVLDDFQIAAFQPAAVEVLVEESAVEEPAVEEPAIPALSAEPPSLEHRPLATLAPLSLELSGAAPHTAAPPIQPLPATAQPVSFVPLTTNIPGIRPALSRVAPTDYGIGPSAGEIGASSAAVANFRPPRWAKKPAAKHPPIGIQPVFAKSLVFLARPDALGQYPAVRDCGSYPERLFVRVPSPERPLPASTLADTPCVKPEAALLPAAPVKAVDHLAVEAHRAQPMLDWTLFPGKLAIRRLKRRLAATLSLPAGESVAIPSLAGIRLPVEIKQHGITAPFWPTLLPSRPRLQVKWQPFAEEHKRFASSLNIGRSPGRRPHQAWEPLVHLWRSAPADLKWLALALPVIFLFVVQSRHNGLAQKALAHNAPPAIIGSSSAGLPGGPVETASQTGMATSTPLPAATALPAAAMPGTTSDSGFRGAMAVRWQTLQKIMASRAAVELSDDFRFGLTNWSGRKEWAKTWSYDAGGSVSTGALALYKPSTGLVDYRMEFLGCIEKKAIGWVFRAKDSENYYALKLVITKPGPLPLAAIERYAVIDGKETQHYQVPLPLTVRNDSLYRIRTEVNGSDFTTSVQGQVVDHFTDERLKAGGVGFFSGRGEQARLRWVEVSHQYDMLGQFFAMITPYDPQAKSDLGDR